LLTTINARYYPVEGVADAYCLDGKFPGKRELRAVNLTLDREARGFLVSVFAYPSDTRSRQLAWQEPLRRLANQLVSETGDIDTDINDLAETALDVTGGLKLSEEAARAPYFAGIILRDGEMAAVTVGGGQAFIYRQDALYPLTGQSGSMDAVDLYGDAVEGLEDFIAGEAGAIRYSNIAQVEEGDVIVLCNGELFDVIGQKEFMRHLSDAEDPMDAAGLLMTAAASQTPGTPIQVTVSKVDRITAVEQSSKFSLGRFATQAMEPVIAPTRETTEPELAPTQRYERQDKVDRARQAPPQWETEDGPDSWALPPLPVSEATEPFEAVAPRMGHEREQTHGDYQDDFPSSDPAAGWETLKSGDYREDSLPPSGGGELPVFAYSQAAQKRHRDGLPPYDDYDRQGDWDTGEDLDRAPRDYDPYGDYDDFDDGYGRKRTGRPDGKRRLVFYAILLAIIVVCIVALIKLLAGDKKKPVETEPATTAPLIIPTQSMPPPTTVPTEPTEPVTTEPEGQTHIVVAGDTWWGICMRYYDRASESLCEKLAEYNDMSVRNLYVGNKVKIPPLSELLGD
jgi:hypothetical protein